MYYILTLKNGQPIVLYHENDSVYMYSLSSGKIYNKGLLFTNVSSDFEVFGTDEYYVYYKSKDRSYKLYKLIDNRFSEIISLNADSLATDIHPVFCCNNVYLFFKQAYNEDSDNYLYCCSSCLPNNSTRLMQVRDNLHNILYFINNNSSQQMLYLLLSYDDDSYELYTIDVELNATKIELTDSISQKIIELKDKEIAKLESTKEHITYQYNDLAGYATELQNELRKIRYRY